MIEQLFPDSKSFDQLFDTFANLTAKRQSKEAAGDLFLQRGWQKLGLGKKYEAIKIFGLAQYNLTMEECRDSFVDSLVGCALAYESAGLLWAARRNILAAASLNLDKFYKYGVVIPSTLHCLQKLVWLELQLGRVPYVLSWIEASSTFANTLVLNDSKKARYIQDRENQDLVLGLLLLKTKLSELGWLDFVPDMLDKFGLTFSWMAMLYSLGHENILRQEKVIPADQNNEATIDFFGKWLSQTASTDLPEYPEFLAGTEITLNTYVIGCKITIDSANNFDSLCLGETIIAVLEAFCATGIDRSILPYQPSLHIKIKPSEYVTGLPKYRVDETSGIKRIEILHVPMLARGLINQSEAYREWLREIMILIICQIAIFEDPKVTLDKMEKEGAVFSRALSLIDTDICITNILGNNPKFCLWGWRDKTVKLFPLHRNKPWYEDLAVPKRGTDLSKLPPFDCGQISWPSGLDNLKHRDMHVYSVINMPLWDKAGWKAMVYYCPPNEPPSLAFGFSNQEAGTAIFKAWHSRFGEIDENEHIRVSIITGIDKNQPYSYNIIVGVNPEIIEKGHFAFMVFRAHRMDPYTPHNLSNFLSRFQNTNTFMLMPAFIVNISEQPKLFPELRIGKRKLRICEAWQIDEHDPDICGLSPDMNPIIPEGIENPPIYRAFKLIAKLREARIK